MHRCRRQWAVESRSSCRRHQSASNIRNCCRLMPDEDEQRTCRSFSFRVAWTGLSAYFPSTLLCIKSNYSYQGLRRSFECGRSVFPSVSLPAIMFTTTKSLACLFDVFCIPAYPRPYDRRHLCTLPIGFGLLEARARWERSDQR